MKNTLLLYVKGMAMGAVDVVPGFSGGTMALITGIYDRLLAAFAAMPEAAVKLLRGRVAEAWRTCDAGFVITVMIGVLTSVFTLARLISYLMHAHPVLLWSFFFGLVLVSVLLVARQVQQWNIVRALMFVIGAGLAFLVTTAAPVQLQASLPILFIAGAVAISAMILPGISGSFILVLLGLYPVVLGAVKNLELAALSVFAAGCVLGLLGFSRFLSWLLVRARDATMAFLAGVVLGSLGKVWPWKQTLTWQSSSSGERYPLLQENLLPAQFAELTGSDAQLPWAILLCVLAIASVLGTEWLARRRAQQREVRHD